MEPEPFTLENSRSTTFYTFIVNTTINDIITGGKSNDCVIDVDNTCPQFKDLKGAIRFSTDSTNFLSCSVVADAERQYLYVYSTSNWQMIQKMNISVYVNDLLTASHPWTQVESVKSSLYGELFVSVDKSNVLSFWSIPECKLVTRCQSRLSVDVDGRQTIFALSPNRKMLATWTPDEILAVFLCEEGILFSSSMAPKNHLALGGSRNKSVKQLVWIGNKHVMIVDDLGGTKWDIYTYDLISEYSGFGKMPIFKSTGEDVYANCDGWPKIKKLKETKPKNSFNQGAKRSEGTTKMCKYDGTTFYETGKMHVIGENQYMLHKILKNMIEPWYFPQHRTATIFLLDDNNERALFFGKQTITVWNFTSKEPPSLEYIWCKPMPAANYSIDEPSLGINEKGRYILKFRCNFENGNSSKRQELSLCPTRFKTTLHALYARKFLEFKAHNNNPSHEGQISELLKQCEEIVYSTIRTNAEIFNASVGDRSMVHLLIDLDSAFADSMLEALLQKDVYIPLFYKNKESALLCALSKGKAKVVRLLLKYYCRRTEEKAEEKPEFWMQTVVPVFKKLVSKYPDSASELMKSVSDLPLSEQTIWRNQKDLHAFSCETNEIHEMSAPRRADEIDEAHKNGTNRRTICVVPLPGFTEYPDFAFYDLVYKGKECCSRFADAVFYGRIDLFGERITEAIINFKWRQFAKGYAYFLIFLYILYLVSFMFMVTIDAGRVQLDDKYKNIATKVFIFLVLGLGAVFLSSETRQILHKPYYYICNIYNLVDLVSLVMPIAYAINSLVGDGSFQSSYIGASMFFVYLNLILKLRIFEKLGIAIFIIIEIISNVYRFVLAMAIMVLAYTHTYWILLANTEVKNTLDGNNAAAQEYSTFQRGLLSTYFFVTNNLGSLSDAFGDSTIAIFTVAFSVISVYMWTVLVALMTNVVDDSRTFARHAWLKQRAELPQENKVEEPEPFTLKKSKSGIPTTFYTFIVNTTKNDIITGMANNNCVIDVDNTCPQFKDLKGAIRFSTDSTNFLSCSVVADVKRQYLYVYSTSNWQMIQKMNIGVYVNDLLTASHPWTQVESVKSSLYGELFVSVDKWNVLSFWSIPECKLLARCESNHFVDVDGRQTIFALSPNRKMLATWTPTEMLAVFLCEDGILFSSSMAPKNHLALGDRNKSVKQLVWIGNKHVMIVDDLGGTKWDIYTYDLISEYSGFGKMPIFKSTGEDVYANCEESPRIMKLIETKPEGSFNQGAKRLEGTTKLCKYDGTTLYETNKVQITGENQNKLREIVEFMVEPWYLPQQRTTTIFLLDDDNKRALLFGKQTIHVWNFTSTKPSLEYIWCKPMPAGNYSLDEPSLDKDRNILKFLCNSEKKELSLRPTKFETTLHALYARKFLERKDHVERQIGPSHGLLFSTLLKQCEKIVYSTIRTSAEIFNANVDDRSMVHLLIDLDSAFADSMLEALLQKDVYIPLAYENKESALSCALLKGKAKVVRLLLKYYCRRTEEKAEAKPEFWMQTVVPVFKKLVSKYPDSTSELMKSVSDLPFTLSEQTIWRNQKDLHAFICETDEIHEMSAPRRTDEINEAHKNGTNPRTICVVPLPGFTEYPNFAFYDLVYKGKECCSRFADAVFCGRIDLFGERSMEAIINFKWRQFARRYAYFLIVLYILYLASFMFVITVDAGRVQLDDKYKNIATKVFIFLVLGLGAVFLSSETRQILHKPYYYICNIYNLVDLVSLVMPIAYAINSLVGDGSFQSSYIGASMFFVYLNLILKLRIFEKLGIAIFIIIEIVSNVYRFVLAMGIMVLAYTHTYWILLANTEVKNTLDDNNAAAQEYSTFQRGLLSTYFFVTNNLGSLSDAFGDSTIAIFTVAFSVISVYMWTVLVALMTNVVDDSRTVARNAWLKQRAEVIVEIEMYWFTSKQRKRKDYFPSLIYYYASPDAIEKPSLDEETESSRIADIVEKLLQVRKNEFAVFLDIEHD
ncbi:9590_t:CDS:10 [Paraglomus occultum]|uniref:9590_t:CDS:1 n=1 Tax=Paraglomus occultum TaxID=144539 RepID=A0A9N9AJN1_9GLOM|nr:9590_t:CDS:10 [Paraglomus occultum]